NLSVQNLRAQKLRAIDCDPLLRQTGLSSDRLCSTSLDCALVDSAAASRTGRAELALLDLEGQHVEQAGDTIVERLEQGLLLQRRYVEVKAQEIDQVSVAQPLLVDQPTPGGVGILAEKSDQQIAQRVHLGRLQAEQPAARGTPLDLGLPVGVRTDFAPDLEFADSFKLEVVAAVGKLFQRSDPAGASDGKNVGIRVVIALPVALEHYHPDRCVGLGDVGDHLAIARLENMQRHSHVGKQLEIGQRKYRNDVRQLGHRGPNVMAAPQAGQGDLHRRLISE